MKDYIKFCVWLKIHLILLCLFLKIYDYEFQIYLVLSLLYNDYFYKRDAY